MIVARGLGRGGPQVVVTGALGGLGLRLSVRQAQIIGGSTRRRILVPSALRAIEDEDDMLLALLGQAARMRRLS